MAVLISQIIELLLGEVGRKEKGSARPAIHPLLDMPQERNVIRSNVFVNML